MTTKMRRRNIFVPDPLWVRMEDAAEAQSQTEGRTVSVAELVREAIGYYLSQIGS